MSGRQNRQRRLLFKPFGDGAPVYDVPNRTKVFRLAVLVLQVVRVLPGVNPKKRLEVAHNRILVRTGYQRQSTRSLVLDEPCPPRALDARKSSIGLLLQVIKGSEILLDGSLR